MAERTDLTTVWEESPRIVEVAAPSTSIIIQDLHDTLNSNTEQASHTDDSLDSMDDEPLIDSAGKEDLGGGNAVGITATMQNAQVAFEERTTVASEGTATAIDTGTTLTDAAATFITDGVERGALIVNFDDQSVCSVLKIISETELTHKPLVEGQNNDWEVGDQYKVWNIVQVEVSGGNIVAVDDVGASISPIYPSAFTQVVRAASTSATITNLTGIESDINEILLNTQTLLYNDHVHVDVNGGVAGTAFPIGLSSDPVNNITDALTILHGRALERITVAEDAVVAATDDLTGVTIEGSSAAKSEITLTPGCKTDLAQFEECNLTGTADGPIIVRESLISDLEGFSGIAFQCAITGFLRLSSAAITTMILQCYAEAPETPAEIDMAVAGAGIAVRDWNGPIKFTNSTGGHPICLDYAAARIEIDGTVTSGNVHITGSGGLVTDNSTGTAIVDVLAAMTADQLYDIYTSMGFNVEETATVTPAGLTTSSGSINVVFTGDGVASTTMTRQP